MNRFDLAFHLDPRHKAPLYRQIYQRVKQAIMAGQLKHGSRVPSVRALASELGVARATVENAYGLLMAEGFLQSRGQAGTVVSAPESLSEPAPRRSEKMPGVNPSTRCYLPFLPCLSSSGFRHWMRSRVRSGRALFHGKFVTPA